MSIASSSKTPALWAPLRVRDAGPSRASISGYAGGFSRSTSSATLTRRDKTALQTLELGQVRRCSSTCVLPSSEYSNPQRRISRAPTSHLSLTNAEPRTFCPQCSSLRTSILRSRNDQFSRDSPRHYSSRAQQSSGKPSRSSTKFPTDEWETIIGLEVHTQLMTPYKLFSKARTPNSFAMGIPDKDAPEFLGGEPTPNSLVELLDRGTPGTLPVINPSAVELALKLALALNCTVNTRSTFDRKHYFYHDIPASYQITQKYNPLATDGWIALEDSAAPSSSKPTASASSSSDAVGAGEGSGPRVRIQQIQIEQDTAKTSADSTSETGVFVDLNRAGVGLLEIVSEPDMRSPSQAGAYIKKLQGILRRLGVSDGDMEKGSLRVDANVSIHRRHPTDSAESRGTSSPAQWGTRCEIKNLNSVRFMQQALEAERWRHLQHYLDHPDTPLKQETRGFNEQSGQTYSMRSKEEAEDYRYMPDLNLPPIAIDSKYMETVRQNLPEMPDQLLTRLVKDYSISQTDADSLIAFDDATCTAVEYFEQVMQHLGHKRGKKPVNWIVNEYAGQLASRQEGWRPDRFPAQSMAELVSMVEKGTLTGTSAKHLLKEILSPTVDSSLIKVEDLAKSLNILSSPSNSSELQELCRSAMEKMPAEVESARKGNPRVIMRLVGHVMKASKGTANAKQAQAILADLLSIDASSS